MLMPDQRALLSMHCNDHPVAVCPRCLDALTVYGIGADVILGTRDFCPKCRADLSGLLLEHLAECTSMRVQERENRERVPQSGLQARAPSQRMSDRQTPDTTREALQESERLREMTAEAIDRAQRLGRDYLPAKHRQPPAPPPDSTC